MGSPELSHCRSCGAPILWIETAKGKKQPLDAKPEKRVILWPPGGEATRGMVVDAYMPHHATCPHADQWRRGQ